MSTEPTKMTDGDPSSGGQSFGVKAVGVIAITAVLAWGLGFGLLPLIQGRQEGLDWFTSLCRAAGIYAKVDQEGKPVGSVSLVTWSPAVMERISDADLKQGEAIAAETCAACHNPNGMSSDPATMPSIAGQPARALYKQLWDIKNGTRINEAMKPLVDDLNDQQIASVAAYYSRRKSRYDGFVFEPEESPQILKLVTMGDSRRALPACRSCHDTVAGGPIEAPNLVGQYPGYTALQLDAFATNSRRNDLFGRMRTIATKLTPAERAALAQYYDGPR